MISASPDRHTFQKQKYIEGCLEAGQSLDDPAVRAMLEIYESWALREEENLVNAEWQKNNMEFDMRTSDWMVAKVRESRVYAQNLYAALCNNTFQKQDVWTILKDQTWACTWRSAGGIVANMRGEGDYIDWYCSGIRDQMATLEQAEWNMLTQEQQTFHKESQAHVSESVVTDEIREDLGRLAWTVVTDSESY
jgi:hypothetical protein